VRGYDRVVWWVADRLEGVEPAYRRDVAVTTHELTVEAGFWTRSLELVALVGLALRLRSGGRTGNRPEVVWHQGLYLGSVVLLAVLASAVWAQLAEPARGAGSPAVAVTLAAAAALAASIACALRRHRSAAALLAAVGAVAHLGATAHGAEAGMFAGSCVVAIGGLVTGTPPPAARARWRALAASALPLAGLPVALAVGADATASATALAFTGVGPVAMVALGWFDPRLAAAATVLVFSRLLASGFDELGQALAVLAQNGQGALLVRWALMGTGVLGAWFATQRSIRRLTRL
jgi:hypothetical protein